jgi:hypothetical protein
MFFPDYEEELKFRDAWDSVDIARNVGYGLFTFGHSDLQYYLVCDAEAKGKTVSVQKGQVRIDRPLVITPGDMQPGFRDFFEDSEGESYINFLLSRTAAFSNLRVANQTGPVKLVSDSVEEIVAKLNKQLDDEEEDQVAILTAPAGLGGLAVLRYTTERVVSSGPDNVQELRDRGFLP